MKVVLPFALLGWCWLVSVAGAGAGEVAGPTGPAAAVPGVGGPRWRVGLGAQWRAVERLSLQASPRASLGAAGRLVDRAGGHRPDNGPAGATGDRRYGDGFVYEDEGTAQDGGTWWWGYESASQVQGDTLSFTAEGDYTTASSWGRAEAWRGEGGAEDGGGPVLEVGADWDGPGDWRPGWAFSFSQMGLESEERAVLFSGGQQSSHYLIRETDRYALAGVVVPLAPYQGSKAGPGPVIDNIPTRSRRDSLLQQREEWLASEVEVNFAAEVYNFSLGTTLAWERGRWSWQGGVGLEVDVVSWDLASREVLRASGSGGERRLAGWQDGAGGTAVVCGLGLGGRAAWQWRPGWEVAGLAKWRAMERFEVSRGQAGATLNSGGWSVGLTLGRLF